MERWALPREYRIRVGSAAGSYAVLAIAGVMAVIQLVRATYMPVSIRVAVLLLLMGFVSFVTFARPRRFTKLDDKGLALRSALRVRRLHWAELHDIRVEAVDDQVARMGGPTVHAYAYRSDGKRVPLPCLDDRELPGVRGEVARIRSVWTELRGPGWRRDPQVESRIARAAARRERRLRAFSGPLGHVLAAAVVGAVIVFGVVLFG